MVLEEVEQQQEELLGEEDSRTTRVRLLVSLDSRTPTQAHALRCVTR